VVWYRSFRPARRRSRREGTWCRILVAPPTHCLNCAQAQADAAADAEADAAAYPGSDAAPDARADASASA
jgi:hypothetical protein